MKHTPAATEPIVVECDLPYPPAQVWRAVTEQNLLGAWLMPNDLRPEAGARFRFQPDGRDPGNQCIDCEVLEAEPHRTLRWRQSEATPSGATGDLIESVVTVELTGTPDGGTHLRLVHDAFTLVSIEARRRSIEPRACATIFALKFGSSGRRYQPEDTGHLIYSLRRAA